MKHIYIYGAGLRGAELLKLIDQLYSKEISVDGFIDINKKGKVETYPIFDPKDKRILKDSIIVISLLDFNVSLEIATQLREIGFNNLYWFDIKHSRYEYEDFFSEQCVSCDDWTESTLLHVEMHAMDACNLNCVGCTHYSPIFDKVIPDTNSRLEDLSYLKNKISSIVDFFILGGEPLLNKELDKYILAVRQKYPNARITIVTNGILLLKCSAQFFQMIKNENVCISISEYAPTHQMIDQIIALLSRYNIIYSLRPYDQKQKFNIPLSFEKTGEKYCISNGCINVWNKKIARCPTLMYITELNRKYNLCFPEEGIIDLKSNISGKALKELLEKDVPLCDYCSKNDINWRVCEKEVKSSDFIKF